MSNGEESAKPRIVTIHGVNSRGEWQEEVAAALGVFFRFDAIKYNHYRWFFGTELLFNPLIWLPLSAALAVAVDKGWIYGGWELSSALLVIAALAHLGSYPYRWCAERKVRQRLSGKFGTGGAPPHLIAHSFGTYISGRALRFANWPYFNRIVLAGCVLDGNYPWNEIRQSSRNRFDEVRNEMAARDNIARLAAKLDSFIPGFGSAGYSGFKGSVDWVHDVDSANTVCSICEKSNSRVLLHNVKSEELGHSDVFLGPAYAVIYWLPFLWRYDPPAYRNFLALCFEIDEAMKSRDKQRMKEKYLAVRKSAWGQTPRRTLEEEIRYTVPVPAGHTLSEAEIDQIATESVRFVLLGQAALDDAQTAERAKFVQLLNIFVAIDSAWRKTFPTMAKLT